MKPSTFFLLVVSLFSLCMGSLHSATIFQGAGSTYVAFEGEGNPIIIAGTPETWVSTNDAAASGGTVLYADGANNTANSPQSFAQYSIKFVAAGTYYLYYRWKADPSRTGGDAFTANSAWLGNTFGAYSTPGDQSTFHRSDSNGDSAPNDNVFAWRKEPDAAAYTVSAADISAGTPLVLTVGTREAGMEFDRFVLSTDNTLSSAQLDALLNSETDIVVQGPTDNFASFEADGAKAKIIPGTPETWVSTNDAAATGGTVLYADGANNTANSPHSFVQYQIKFATAGTYYLYYRWKADPSRTGGDAFTANSAWLGNTFGAYSTPGDQSTFHRSDSNGDSAPNDNVFAWRKEPDAAAYTVSTADISAGTLVFTVGTREAGMEFDRFVFSTDNTLTAAQLDAIPNSGAKPVAPEIARAVGSASLDTVTIFFTRPLAAATVTANKFTFDGGLSANNAVVDATDSRIVVVTTSQQTAGQQYKVTVNGVTDTSGTAIAPNTSANFTAWKIVAGWATKEVYFAINGGTVADLTGAPKFPSQPDRFEWIKGFQLNDDPLTDNYGARLTALFKPSASEVYNFYVNNDDEAELQLSSDQTAANLQSLGTFPASPRVFDDAITAPSPTSLTANSRYLLVGLLKQATGPVYLNVAAKRQSDPTPAANLTVLSGDQIAAWVNPDLGGVTFNQQPASATATAGSRAKFSVSVKANETPVYYQWRANGAAIPGATLATYVTPVLTTGDSGKTYDVVISVAGKDTPSSVATLTVNPGEPSNIQPYLGINFVGGGTFGGASLSPVDVAGAVLQEHWNNLEGFTFDQVPLGDAAGASTPVTLSTDPAPNAPTEVWYSGTKALATADGLLLQGFISAGASTDPVNFRLNNVPSGTYNLLVYGLGFDFSANYYQSYSVTAAGNYPTYHGKVETGLNFIANPAFRRMSSTTAGSPDAGNYVQFDSVSPAADGSMLVAVTWEPPDPSINNSHQPAISAIQLAKVLPVTVKPTLQASATQPGTLTISWPASAAGFVLESSATLGAGATWTFVSGTPNPISGPGSTSVSTATGTQFYRLRK